MDIKGKQVLAYFVMPQILPRLRELTEGGFAHVSFFVAQIFAAARLLPYDHPYLAPENMGRYGLRHVYAEAGRSLVFDKKHIDQLCIYFLMTLGLVILCMQFFLFGVALFSHTVHAAALPNSFAGFFVTPDNPVNNEPSDDVALNILDRVFGVPDVFDTLTTTTRVADQGNWPNAFHTALHGMLQTYSTGLLVVGLLIFLYFVVTTVLETAHTGTPFGRRFNHLWAPLRMVVALGLLVPLASGLNSAQYIALYAAKYGSGFATNGWLIFTETIFDDQNEETPLGDPSGLVAVPETPPVNGLLQFMSLVATCHNAMEDILNYEVEAYLVNGKHANQPYLRWDDALPYSNGGNIADTGGALEYSEFGDINIMFGSVTRGHEAGTPSPTSVDPLCGKLRIPVSDVSAGPFAPAPESPGSHFVQAGYYGLARLLWVNARINIPEAGNIAYAEGALNLAQIAEAMVRNAKARESVREPPASALKSARDLMDMMVTMYMENGALLQAGNANWGNDLRRYGWGGAGIFYNRLAQMNGRYISAVYNLPYGIALPAVMSKAESMEAREEANVEGAERFRCNAENSELGDERNKKVCDALFWTLQLWENNYSTVSESGSIFVDILHQIFGTRGLFNVHENIENGVHPLAVLSAIGKSVMDSTILNLFGATVFGVMGVTFTTGSAIFYAISSFAFQIAILAMAIGFVLFYVVPFLPFIYFFFAVGGWIKGLFEAMVGVPLWALAHIKIDGNGLPGDAAMGGYYMILEIFLRPILILFGLIASILVFSAQVLILEDIWKVVVTNISGFDREYADTLAPGETGALEYARGIVDQFFFLIIFTVIIYLLAMASFKMVDLIPKEILRWMGASVQTFGDQTQDPAENLVRNTLLGGRYVGGGLQGAMDGAKQAGSGFGKMLGRNQPTGGG